jgi:hypothetical protein
LENSLKSFSIEYVRWLKAAKNRASPHPFGLWWQA